MQLSVYERQLLCVFVCLFFVCVLTICVQCRAQNVQLSVYEHEHQLLSVCAMALIRGSYQNIHCHQHQHHP